MAHGFKDSSGKFHPTGNNGTSSREKSTQAEGMIKAKMRDRAEKFIKERELEKLKKQKKESDEQIQKIEKGIDEIIRNEERMIG